MDDLQIQSSEVLLANEIRETRKERKDGNVTISVKSLIATFVLIVIAVAGGVGGFLYFDYMDQWISTNNARIDGRIYTVTAGIPGFVETVESNANSPVSKGDTLLTLDSTMQRLAVEKIEAAIETNMRSIEALRNDPNLLQELQIARAKQEELNIFLEEAQVVYAKTDIKSPAYGYVAKSLIKEGEFASPGQPLKYVVNDEDLWITANFSETQIRHVRVGQNVDIFVDAFPNETFEGRIVSIMPAGGGAFALFPADPTAGNWVRTTQKIPVRIEFTEAFDQDAVLRIGMLATVRVER